MPPPKRKGLTRLGRYLVGRRIRVTLLAVVGICSAAAPVSALVVVQDAIDHGMRAHDTTRLSIDVAIYLGVNAIAWVLTTTMILPVALALAFTVATGILGSTEFMSS